MRVSRFAKAFAAVLFLLAFCVPAGLTPAHAAVPKKKSQVHWMDYNTALAKAKQNPKLIFVDLFADWCVPCRIMEANVYSDPTVASVLNSRFYAVKLNAESQDTISCDGERKTVQRCYFDTWELSALPAFVLVAPKGLTILTVTDSMSPEEMQSLLFKFLVKEEEWIKQ